MCFPSSVDLRGGGKRAMPPPRRTWPQQVLGEAIWNARKHFRGSLQHFHRPVLVERGLAASSNTSPAPSPLTQNRRLGPFQHDGLDPPRLSVYIDAKT